MTFLMTIQKFDFRQPFSSPNFLSPSKTSYFQNLPRVSMCSPGLNSPVCLDELAQQHVTLPLGTLHSVFKSWGMGHSGHKGELPWCFCPRQSRKDPWCRTKDLGILSLGSHPYVTALLVIPQFKHYVIPGHSFTFTILWSLFSFFL